MSAEQEVVTSARVLATRYVLVDSHRLAATNEPGGGRGPSFALVRDARACAWAAHADLPAATAAELDALAADEPPWLATGGPASLAVEPVHAARYRALVAGPVGGGPTFLFPAALADPGDTCVIEDEEDLAARFRGWVPGEIAAGRAPVIAAMVDGAPASICFCARRGDLLAEAGVETAEAFRRRGLATRVTAAWAHAIRASGLAPVYSTSWTNQASRAVARRLGLVQVSSDWAIER